MFLPLSAPQSSEATSAERFEHEVESASQQFALVGDAMIQLQKNMLAELKQKESHIQSLKSQLNHAKEGRRELQTELAEITYQSNRAKQELSNAHEIIERLQRQVARLLEVEPDPDIEPCIVETTTFDVQISTPPVESEVLPSISHA